MDKKKECCRPYVGSLSFRKLSREAEMMQTALRWMLPHDLRKRKTVCVAGAAALLWYMLRHVEAPTLHHCLFEPEAIEIFVFGRDGKTYSFFKKAVRAMLDSLKKVGKKAKRVVTQTNDDLLRDSVRVIEVVLRGFPTKLKFVQCSLANTAEDVVERFDIDISKVIYDTAKNDFRVGRDVASNIAQTSAVAEDVYCLSSAPSVGETALYMSTLVRMSKYTRRGFRFRSFPAMIGNTSHSGTTDTDIYFRQQLKDAGSGILIDTLQEIINFMYDVIPTCALRRGTVGLCGELLLSKVVGKENWDVASRVARSWVVPRVSIYVCGFDAISEEMFTNATGIIKKRLQKSPTYTVDTRSHKREIAEGIWKRTNVMSIKLKELDVMVEFVRCPGFADVRALAEASVISIDRIWYDFVEERCKLLPGVEYQLKTGKASVKDKIIESYDAECMDRTEIRVLMDKISQYHSRGFEFDRLPAIIQTPKVNNTISNSFMERG